MIFRYLSTGIYSFKKSNHSFLIKQAFCKDVLIFNCSEGCQINLLNQGFKINNLSKIIVADLHINNISGLLGLLSSLNLIGRTKSLHIYIPCDLKYYVDLGKKYSHTNFNYVVYFHVLKTGLIINSSSYRFYTFFYKRSYVFVFMQLEKYGTFFFNIARKNYLNAGPLYGKLKEGHSFLFSDGFVLDGTKLTQKNLVGQQLSIFKSFFYYRHYFENSLFFSFLLIL
uniref:Ribonuclease Z n=1 Tax=Bostrychia moritziana TaxID=103713 RepID=A0A1Z1M6W6_BOSMO|nr:ribonuclease Z [Bostrychia moritziana]ARW61581.1 ribonuclease Z [Bostrychia moritziana]